jgi:hypothetical protein
MCHSDRDLPAPGHGSRGFGFYRGKVVVPRRGSGLVENKRLKDIIPRRGYGILSGIEFSYCAVANE